jgi:hypothetical protein
LEIQIYNPTQGQPLPPVKWNYDEVRQWIKDGLAKYEGLVYDESRMADAKKDRANLNKLAQAIDAKRREMKQLYLEPYEEFESQAKELTAMVKDQAAQIDAQVKSYETQKKEEKRQMIEAELYAPMIGSLSELVPYNRLHEARWLNVTCSIPTISEELGKKIDRIISGLDSIKSLDLPPELASHARDVFLKSFDLADAIKDTERKRLLMEAIEKHNASESAQNAAQGDLNFGSVNTATNDQKADTAQSGANLEEVVVEFRVKTTRAKLKALGEYMRANGIRPERI